MEEPLLRIDGEVGRPFRRPFLVGLAGLLSLFCCNGEVDTKLPVSAP